MIILPLCTVKSVRDAKNGQIQVSLFWIRKKALLVNWKCKHLELGECTYISGFGVKRTVVLVIYSVL